MYEKQKHFWLYVLRLKQGKYYVGVTSQKDPEDRIAQHKNGFYSAQWVKKYGYESTLQIHDLGVISPEEAEVAETKLTFDMMAQYGVENVRGGKANFSGKYFSRFGYLFREDDWRGITTTVFLMLVITFLLVDKYFLS
jgi:predicted GIY-YIG superfamily endonuclease